MCKHAKDSVDKLATRQRGLDARGNDPMATKRESSFAAAFIAHPPGDLMACTLNYLNGLGETDGQYEPDRVAPFKQKLHNLGDEPTGMDFANFFADGNNTQFKQLIDQISVPIVRNFGDVEAKARLQPAFLDRGRDAAPRKRRQSIDTRHVGITTGKDRTDDTRNVYAGDYFHAQAQFVGRLNSETVKQFQKTGAPFVGGASGTIQAIAMEMETRGKLPGEEPVPVDALDPEEKLTREKVLAMFTVQHVAAGHHSMAECLISAKAYGYFSDVPDPLTDYDGAMAAFERRIAGFDPTAQMPPLSRDSENEDKSRKQVAYEDRLAFVKTHWERYEDQLPPDGDQKIRQRMTEAATLASQGNYGRALDKLDKADKEIRGQAALITAKARGNNNVLTPTELDQRMRMAAPKGRKDSSVEYKAVKAALARFEKSMKELGGRRMDHDRVTLGFESLRADLAAVQKAAQDYDAAFADNPAKANARQQMTELRQRIIIEMGLLAKAEKDSDAYAQRGDVTFEQAIEYARFDVKPGTQARPDVLKESRISNKKVLGAGGISTVMLIDYDGDDTHAAEQRAFKPEQSTATTHDVLMNELGIDPNKPKFGKRNIASKKMADAAGLGSMMPDAAFAIVDGKLGLSMQKAGGVSPVKRVTVEVTDPANNQDLAAAIAARRSRDPDWKSKIPAKNGRGMRYGFDDRTGTFTIEEQRAPDLPFESPPARAEDVAAVQQQMVNMQWLDALCGQTDRHAENYLIDMSGGTPTVMGIDNDFSFGKNRKDPAVRKSSALGLPPIIDRATFTKLTTMDWDALAISLADELDPEEIAAAKDRFDAVQAKLDELDKAGMVVDSWDDTVNVDGETRTVTQVLMAPDNFETYFQREVEYQKFVKASETDREPITE